MPPRPRPAPAGDGDASGVAFPSIKVDPLASFAPASIEVETFGQTWVVPAMSAAQWLPLLWEGDPDAIFPGVTGAGSAALDALLSDEVTPRELFDTAMEVVSLATGMDWWFAIQLAAVVRASWHNLGGALVIAGVCAEELSIGAWLVACLNLIFERSKPEKLTELLNRLNTPPRGFEDQLDQEAEGDAFLSAMRQAL